MSSGLMPSLLLPFLLTLSLYVVFFTVLLFFAKRMFRIDEIVKCLQFNKEQNDILIQQNDEIKNLLTRN
jgi:hypothetical protein